MTSDQLYTEFKSAMKSHDVVLLSAIKQVRQIILDLERDEHRDSTEADVANAIKKVIRITTEERDSRQKVLGPHEERVVNLTRQLDWLNAQLPQALTENQLVTLVAEAITNTNATGMRDMRNIIAYVTEHANADFNNADVSRIVKNYFSKTA